MSCYVFVSNPRDAKHAQDMQSRLAQVLGLNVHPIRDPPRLAFAAFGSLAKFEQVCKLSFVTCVRESVSEVLSG
jgi:hypothetical protein